MSIRRVQILEGIGKVRSGDHVIENVAYTVEEFREFQEGQTHDGPYKIEVGGRIEGGIRTDSKALFDLSMAGRATLEMKDGYKLDFFLENSGSGRITATGPIYRDDTTA